MSRSKRKHPCYHIGCPKNKRDASKMVRRYKGELANGNFYKKLYESYNIIDYVMLDESQIQKNKEFRKVARIVRNISKGRISSFQYNFTELLRILEDTSDSFWYTNKK